ncbi:sensor domain-containing diguanylate cyclase [Acidihalobacter ferrooxydans]|uniref:Diguanylate cyclase n=1 Tax=Acidihalobacter ferrooxydans TaxID=1765967 RepID=A0A1P8UHJ1_9GAMM|nr:GGDEF domain-containing protein [Acidihalobacter ferrooxydans]APZ43306.1 diguanylate cyclase [Acidihalobacter ferrooxydans]
MQSTRDSAFVMLDQLSAGVVLFVGDVIRYANPAAMRFFEAAAPAQVLGRSVMEFIHPLDQARVTARIRSAEALPQQNLPTEIRIHTCTGGLRVIALTSATYAVDGENGLLTTFIDMTARSEMEQRLRESDENFRSMLENMQDVFYRTDAQGITRLVCPAVRNILGYEAEEIIGRPAADFYPNPDDRYGLSQAVLRDGAVRDYPGQMVCKDGRIIDISINTRALYDEEGNFAGVEGIWRDITERRNLERELERHATTDELTGISNRRTILEQIKDAIERCRRYRHPYALLMLDLDHFKAVNDKLGHLAGDRVLQYFAATVSGQLRSSDRFGRLGGEEFCVLLEQAGLEEAEEVAERIRRAVHEAPMRDEEFGTLVVTVSIGAAYCTKAVECGVSELLETADRALYVAKQAGRNRVHWSS